MAELHMLTTVDNPYNPFKQWDEWHAYDLQAGYYTSELLARIAATSDELSPADEDLALETAIDEVVRENPLGIYRKVTAEDDMKTQAAAAVAQLAERAAA